IKAASHPVLDDGRYYPHHNLYFVTSDVWDMEVLGGLLLSDVANLFVGAYCVKMRGGCYRFQGQYLCRIRVPAASSLPRPARLEPARAMPSSPTSWHSFSRAAPGSTRSPSLRIYTDGC